MATNPNLRRIRQASVAALALCLAVGCAKQPDPPVAAPVETPDEAPAAEAPAEAEPAPPTPEPPAEPEKPVVEQAAWRPPFPNRADLFQPPRYTGRVVRTDDEGSESVVLMGFADLGTPMAVLAIDGVVTPLAEQGEDSGVEVISIAPPRCVLQRGRTRWTASIE